MLAQKLQCYCFTIARKIQKMIHWRKRMLLLWMYVIKQPKKAKQSLLARLYLITYGKKIYAKCMW